MQCTNTIYAVLVRPRLAAPNAGTFVPSGEGQDGRRVPVKPAACRDNT